MTCLLCNFAAVSGKSKISLVESTKSLNIDEKPSNTSEKRLCSNCFSVLAKGFSHVCNDTTALGNLISLREKKPIFVYNFPSSILQYSSRVVYKIDRHLLLAA